MIYKQKIFDKKKIVHSITELPMLEKSCMSIVRFKLNVKNKKNYYRLIHI